MRRIILVMIPGIILLCAGFTLLVTTGTVAGEIEVPEVPAEYDKSGRYVSMKMRHTVQ